MGKEAEKWAKNEAPPGAIVVSPKLEAQIRAEIKAIFANAAARELVESIIEREVSIRWMSHDGHMLKCRPDAITPTCWIDLKTTKESNIPRDFHKSVTKHGYHIQDAWYREGMTAAGYEVSPIRFVVVSTSLPHECHVVTLPDAIVLEGYRLMQKGLNELRVREDLDWWQRDQHGEVFELHFPPYAYRSNEDR